MSAAVVGVQQTDMFSELLRAFSVVAHRGGEYLDLVNFNRALYREVVRPADVEEIFDPVHGYGCPDGSFELGRLIRALEWKRDHRFRSWAATPESGVPAELLPSRAVNYDELAVGTGVGTTGVMACLIRAILDVADVSPQRVPNVVVCTPNYPVYDAIVRSVRVESKHLLCTEADCFLPTAAGLRNAINDDTVAFLITFPNNPAQTTYEGARLAELKSMIELCRERSVYMIVDNIYQDTLWDRDRVNPEIFSLTDTPDYLIKVFGPSKDRPFFAGRRLGYYLGDRRIERSYFYYASILTNTHNSHSTCMFALDLLFRRKLIEKSAPDLDDCRDLDSFLSGWNIRVEPERILGMILERGMMESYSRSCIHNDTVQATTLREVRQHLQSLPFVGQVVNEDIGNVVLVRVDPVSFPGTSSEFFRWALDDLHLGVLPATVFGLPDHPGEAWFRMTTIHDDAATLIGRLDRLASALKWKSA